jgi:glycosyltransferase involved in cell wall biosynthesis
LIFEVRDIWPLTLMQVGGFSPRHPFMRLLQWIEDKAYRDSDRVISNLQNAVEHMQARGMDPAKFSWVPNGFSMAEVSEPEPLDPATSAQLPQGKFIVGYTGTLGVANALDTLLKAAERLKAHDDIAFVLVGGGKEKATLKQQATELGLDNVVFIDPIPKAQIQTMLARFDVCFIGWRDEPLYRFGIGANKIPEYLYSAKPILHSFSGKCDPVAGAGAGITIPAEDPGAIAEGVLELKALPESSRDEMGRRGRVYALEKHDYSSLATNLAAVIHEVCQE